VAIKVIDIIKLMDKMAPPHLTENWDNSGLQIGDPSWPVRKVWVALDPLPEVVAKACEADVDLLIIHHPLIMTPIKSLDLSLPTGQIIARAIRSRMALFCAHTNFDSAQNGLNDLLCKRIGLADLKVLAANEDFPDEGIGRIGTLAEAQTLKAFADIVKSALGLNWIRLVGDPAKTVEKVAVCTGSGESLMEQFLTTDADVYVTGDLKYHNARDAEAAGRALLDIGHFPSEHLMVEPLAERLQGLLSEVNAPVTVGACKLEKDPFVMV
jgi:dinuclear metal center YbgI/SA1388 family protein